MEKLIKKEEAKLDKIVVKNRGEATAKILATFRDAQRENYSELDFHNENHPEMVRKKALEFAKIIMRIDPLIVTKDTLADIVNSAASHDSVLNVAHGEIITRFRGFLETDLKENYRPAMKTAGIDKGNELLSFEWLERELDRYIAIDGSQIFDSRSKNEMAEAIAATFPEFDFVAKITDEDFEHYFGSGKTQEAGLEKYRTGIKVWQPHLKPEGSITALAIATGDLRGEAASTNYEDYRQSGNNEFRELNEGLRLAIQQGLETMPHENKEKAANSLLNWIKAQITFAMWQKILFWQSINENHLINRSPQSAEIKQALHNRYDPAFDDNILKSKEHYELLEKRYGEPGQQRTERLTQMTDLEFQELLKNMGFII